MSTVYRITPSSLCLAVGLAPGHIMAYHAQVFKIKFFLQCNARILVTKRVSRTTRYNLWSFKQQL